MPREAIFLPASCLSKSCTMSYLRLCLRLTSYQSELLQHSQKVTGFTTEVLWTVCGIVMLQQIPLGFLRKESPKSSESGDEYIQRTEIAGNGRYPHVCTLACTKAPVDSAYHKAKNSHKVISICWEPFPPSDCSASSFRVAVTMGHTIRSIVDVDPRSIPGTSYFDVKSE